MTRFLKAVAAVGIAGATAVAMSSSGSAHKTVVSQFTFQRDVLPIVRDKCLPCHSAGGAAGLPLDRYDGARASAWPIRQALLSDRMPPGSASVEGIAFKGQRALTADQLNVLMTWAAGGTPPGPISGEPPPPAPPPDWSLGRPGAVIHLPERFVLAAGTPAADHEVTLPVAGVTGRWIESFEVLPETPAIVRHAELIIRTGRDERVAGVWLAGETPQRFAGDAAFRVPRGSSLVIRVHYQRPSGMAAPAISDRSRIGVYFTGAVAPRPIRSIEVTTKRIVMVRDVSAVALRQISGPLDADVRIMAVTPAGVRSELGRVTIRPEFPRRFFYARALRLVKGTAIEMQVTPSRLALWEQLLGARSQPSVTSPSPLFALEVIDG